MYSVNTATQVKGRKKRGTPVISKAVFTLAKFRDYVGEVSR
jgi:hypothetical protein